MTETSFIKDISWIIIAICFCLIGLFVRVALSNVASANVYINGEREFLLQIENDPSQVTKAAQNWNQNDTLQNSEVFRSFRIAYQRGSLSPDGISYVGRIQMARYLAGIFVFAGLAGTVIGIAASLVSLGAVTGSGGDTSQDLSRVMGSIAGVLGGMKSATLCTLFGIGATLWVSYINNKYLMRADRLVAEIEDIWEKTFRRFAQDEEQKREINVLQKALEGAQAKQTFLLRESLATFSATLAETHNSMTDALKGTLLDVRSSVHEVTSSLAGTVAELNSSLLPTATTLKNAAKTAAEVAQTLDTARRETATTATLLTNSLATGQRQTESIERAVEQSAGALSLGYSQLQNIAGSLETTVIGLSDERAQALAALSAERTQALTALTEERLATLDALSDDRAELLGSLKSDRDAMLGTIKDEREATVKAASSEARLARDAAKRAEDASISLRDVMQIQHNEQKDQVRELLTGVRASDRYQAELLARFEETLTDIAALSEHTALREAVSLVSETLGAASTDTKLSLAALTRNTRAIDQTLLKVSISADALRDGIGAWDAQARTQSNSLVETQSRTEQTLSAASDAARDAAAAAKASAMAATSAATASQAIQVAATRAAEAADSLRMVSEAEAARTAAIAELSRLNSFENTILRTESSLYRDYIARTTETSIGKNQPVPTLAFTEGKSRGGDS